LLKMNWAFSQLGGPNHELALFEKP